MKKIAMLTTDIPAVSGSGYKMRCFYFAKVLSLKNKVDIFSLAEKKPKKKELKELSFANRVQIIEYQPREANRLSWFLKRVMRFLFSIKPAGVLRIFNKEYEDIISRAFQKEEYDFVIVEGIWLPQYFKNFPSSKKILNNHNVETVLYKRELKTLNPLFRVIKWVDWLKLRNYEKKQNKMADISLVTSDLDKKILNKMLGEEKAKTISNVVDTKFYEGNFPSPIREKYITFAGLLSYFPNEDGLLWFGREVWPIILKKIPDLKFVILGSNPTPKLKEMFLEKNGIITGFVEDIRPYRRNALAEIVPLRMGGGTRFKILEAFSAEVPVVSTSVGAEGLNAKNNENIMIEDSPKDFADRVTDLIKNEELRAKISDNAKVFVEKKYSWHAISKKLEELIDG